MSTIRIRLRPVIFALVALAAALALIGTGTAAAQPTLDRIQFAPGASGASVAGSIVRGDTNAFLVEASVGQTMTIDIASVEANAVFAVYSPNGDELRFEQVSATIVLPASGDYLIDVGSVRGNTTYELYVTIT
ncbi:hypothetical protein JGU71_26825 [Antrihabitans sp. YC3-6]|uniref:Peptidase C-terminal archaeal/bacterial domain-containing protein n=1 Tax=Antrihabitans stalagmiti TaxID=2799499 RepID=A0A934U6G2_9NOCA|nr:hypothetical protein [Antrihabitans stalagmiti]MBJ8342509.1 hypothetical protein [Antrihabitans stalagmiti]